MDVQERKVEKIPIIVINPVILHATEGAWAYHHHDVLWSEHDILCLYCKGQNRTPPKADVSVKEF